MSTMPQPYLKKKKRAGQIKNLEYDTLFVLNEPPDEIRVRVRG